MLTLSEFLQKKENQDIIVNKIIDKFRAKGEWGKHGLFAEIGRKVGFSPAYVGQVFNGHKPIRESFVEKMADYLGVSVEGFRTGTDMTDGNACDISELSLHGEIIKIVNEFFENTGSSLSLEKKDELTGLLYDVFMGKKIDRLSLQKQIEHLLKII